MTNYTGYLISDSSRSKLEVFYPYSFPVHICHHITVAFGVADHEQLPEQPHVVQAVGYAKDDKIEGFLISIDGNTKRPDGGLYHLTYSRTAKAKDFEMNAVIKNATAISPIKLDVTPKLFNRSTQDYLKDKQQKPQKLL